MAEANGDEAESAADDADKAPPAKKEKKVRLQLCGCASVTLLIFHDRRNMPPRLTRNRPTKKVRLPGCLRVATLLTYASSKAAEDKPKHETPEPDDEAEPAADDADAKAAARPVPRRDQDMEQKQKKTKEARRNARRRKNLAIAKLKRAIEEGVKEARKKDA
ncbi:hypothetical protein B0H14DRAFT_2602232 [Mycena olivaceomarginata]|nr:hypothetical protein B0H14DRAFT_2602232 [Mycena olivaceomarginata]